MDWYPLYNSLRIAAISTVAVFFLGILAAYYIAKLPRLVKGVLDVVPWRGRALPGRAKSNQGLPLGQGPMGTMAAIRNEL